MYQNILIATDGSNFAARAARHGLELAKAMSAKASIVMVTAPWRSVGLSELALGHFEEEYDSKIERYAEKCLGSVADMGRALGVTCETFQVSAERPYEAIIDAAARRGCDLIVVGSHGRRGVTGLILGSETVKILTHSKLPVLVYRE